MGDFICAEGSASCEVARCGRVEVSACVVVRGRGGGGGGVMVVPGGRCLELAHCAHGLSA